MRWFHIGIPISDFPENIREQLYPIIITFLEEIRGMPRKPAAHFSADIRGSLARHMGCQTANLITPCNQSFYQSSFTWSIPSAAEKGRPGGARFVFDRGGDRSETRSRFRFGGTDGQAGAHFTIYGTRLTRALSIASGGCRRDRKLYTVEYKRCLAGKFLAWKIRHIAIRILGRTSNLIKPKGKGYRHRFYGCI